VSRPTLAASRMGRSARPLPRWLVSSTSPVGKDGEGTSPGTYIGAMALGKAELNAMVEEAIIDAKDRDEALMGFFNLMEENLTVPFTTTVLGVAVTVEGICQSSDGSRGARRGSAPSQCAVQGGCTAVCSGQRCRPNRRIPQRRWARAADRLGPGDPR